MALAAYTWKRRRSANTALPDVMMYISRGQDLYLACGSMPAPQEFDDSTLYLIRAESAVSINLWGEGEQEVTNA